MKEKKNYKEKINNLLEAFSELIKNDLEEAKNVLRAAGKDPDQIMEKGIRKLNTIRRKAVYRTRSGSADTFNEEILAFPVFLLDSVEKKVLLSAHMYDERIMTVNEVYGLISANKGPDGVPYQELNIDPEVFQIKFQKQLKEIFYSIVMQPDHAVLKPYLEGTSTVNLTADEIRLVRETGYYITENKCYPVDSESLEFSAEILPDTLVTTNIPLNTALNYFSKRGNFPQITFEQEEFSLQRIIASGLYQRDTSLFIRELYPYQKDGLNWLLYCCINRIGGILADDMGLGKTAQVIALIANVIEKNLLKHILIVVPSTLLENWRREFAFFAPTLTPYIHHGSKRTGSPAVLQQQQIIISSYSMIINDQYLFNKISWGLTVLDEASLIKNPEAERRISLKGLESAVKIAMTGTPVENSLIDLWSIADYVYPGYLGSRNEFSAKYITTNIDESLESGHLAQLRNNISYIMLRRKKEDVLDTLPEKIEIHQALTMHEKEALIYDLKRNEILATASADGTGSNILKMITELRMFTTHPLLKKPHELKSAGLTELKKESFKFTRMMELLHEISVKKEKVLIFTEFLNMIDTLQQVLSATYSINVFTIDGRVAIEERQKNIDRFSEASGFNIMVLNPKTAGMGLNITAANHVIHYTRQWNPALEQQASARSYRNGQKRGVNIYYLFYADSIEEVIDARLQAKMALSGEVISVTETDDMQQYINALIKSPIK